MTKQENLLKRLREHQPVVINYGKGFLSDEDIKDYATWNEELQRYTDETGVWDTKLLIDIAKGESKYATMESGE